MHPTSEIRFFTSLLCNFAEKRNHTRLRYFDRLLTDYMHEGGNVLTYHRMCISTLHLRLLGDIFPPE